MIRGKLRSPIGSHLRQAGLGLAFFLAALGGRLLLDTILPGQLPYVTFFFAIVLTAYFCGPWVTAASVVACGATGALWVVPQGGNPLYRTLNITTFFIISTVYGAVVTWLVMIRARLRRRDAELAMINRELTHRIKNLFAMTSAICLQTLRRAPSTEEAVAAIQGRIQALSAAQDLLSTQVDQRADLHKLIERVVSPVAPHSTRLMVKGCGVALPEEVSTPFALILHELATNALKHGAWVHDHGLVTIAWEVATPERTPTLIWSWRESDVQTQPPTQEGLGSGLIRRALGDGKVAFEVREDGAVCLVRLGL
jgi:two-component sensor histidine kinase